ncbi:MAG: hypothetical protein MJZ64_00060 [Paludibacteraceae bacterium]|nr:hypothetical protein [Paludibacteraceae bacterium]
MNRIFTLLTISALLAIGLSSCKTELDLDNLDTRMQVGMGIAIPVGDMTVTTNDFLGGGQVSQISIDDEGIFHFIDTVSLPTKSYHFLEVSKYACQIPATTISGAALEDGTHRLPFSITIPELNDRAKSEEETNYERIDSIQLTGAQLTINLSNIQSGLSNLKLVLGNQFGQLAGKTYPLNSGNNAITLPAFTANFMIDPSKTGKNNVVNSLEVAFEYTGSAVQKGQNAFSISGSMSLDGYIAAWGYFQASNKMRDRDVICIADEWEDWNDIKKMKLRLMEPKITVMIQHQVAAPLFMYLDTLRVSNAQTYKDATFDNAEQKTKDYFALDNPMSPNTPLSTVCKNYQEFSQLPTQGHIDKLFDIRPDTIQYSFTLVVDKNKERPDYPWNQHRITANTEVSGHAAIDLPFKLNEQSEAQYATTITDVDLEAINLDSLLKEVEIIEKTNAAHIKLFLTFTNNLPFDIDAKVWFLDKDSSEMNLLLFDNQELNEIHLPAPKMDKEPGNPYGRIVAPSTSTIIIDVDQDKCNLLSTCKYIRLDAFMGNNQKACTVNVFNSLKLQVGVAANVEAIMNFNQEKED